MTHNGWCASLCPFVLMEGVHTSVAYSFLRAQNPLAFVFEQFCVVTVRALPVCGWQL